MKKIAIGSDHAGLELKDYLVGKLVDSGYEILDLGTRISDSVDYPDYAKLVSEKVLSGEVEQGILICGTGLGMSISANRFKGIRAALCYYPMLAKLTRQHNNANILCMGGRFIGKELALETANVFLNTEFDGGRHQRRIDKIENC